MKKTIYLFLISFVILYCESPSNNEVSNKDKIFGEWLRKGYSWTGNGFVAGDKKDSDIVKKFMDAYENMDPNLMVEMTAARHMTLPLLGVAVISYECSRLVCRTSLYESLANRFLAGIDTQSEANQKAEKASRGSTG